jgi:NAD-dependent SIR2 family protein deacetylase
MREAKYPITDEKMKELLEKYPFLVYRNVFSDEKCFDEKKDLEINYYKEWDGYGWEGIWKKYLEKLFELYDNKWSEETKKHFQFTEIKEKYGQLRIYTSFTDTEENLESKAEMLSEWTCMKCGKQPRDSRGRHIIWRGWIGNYCKDCAKKENKENYKSWKQVKKDLFGIHSFSKEKERFIFFDDDGNGWLKKVRTEEVWKE